MAYLLHYKTRFERNEGTEEEPTIVEYFQEVSVEATDADYDRQMAFAQAEAYNGEVTVEEIPDPVPAEPTRMETIEAQVTYTAMMTDTLLEV